MISSREKRNSDKNEDSGLELFCPFEEAVCYICRALDWTQENGIVVRYWRLLAVGPQITLNLPGTVFYYIEKTRPILLGSHSSQDDDPMRENACRGSLWTWDVNKTNFEAL